MRTLKPFDYYEPVTVQEATGLMSKNGGKAQILAGGVDLIPRMRKGKIKTDMLVNIQKIPDMSYLSVDGKEGLKFGALTALHTLELSPDIRKIYPILYEAIHQIASFQAKSMGTAVGNLCVATPASDVATAITALGAELTIAGPDSVRTEPIEKFYRGHLETSLRKGEMVTGVSLPGPVAGSGTGFLNLVRTKGDIAKVSVAVAITLNNGICREARIALGAVAPTVFRAADAEAVLQGQKISPDTISKAADAAAKETQPITDVRSSAGYRKEVTGVLVRRALEQALERALAAVGFDGQDPTMPAGSEPANGAAENGLLASCGSSLSERARSGGLAPVVGRQEEIETVLACVSRWSEARLAVIAGESGVGKTNLLHGVAGLLAQRRPAAELIRVDLARAFAGSLFNAEGENLLRTLLDDALASEDTILALENLHLVLGLDQGPLLVTGALDRGARLIGVILSRYVHALLRPPLARRLQLISLPESTTEETIAILDRLRASIAERHGVTIDPACVRTTVRASADLPGRYPAKAVSVLDAAASSAALLGLKAVCADSIYHAATQAAAPAL